jgi:o-succinylbenzoate---CoA ligase
MQTTRSSVYSTLDAIDVPLGSAVLGRMLPAVEAALRGGPPVLPVPTHPASVRDALMTAMRPGTPVEAADDDQVALVVPTSGSTGDPKGVLLGAGALTASAVAAHARLGGSGSWLLALPATHIGGLMVLIRSVLAGTSPEVVDLSAGFDPDSFAVATRRILSRDVPRRYTALVPRQLSVLLDAGAAALDALAAFDAVLVGGSGSAPELLERAHAANVRVVTSYGMTETCGGCVYDGVALDGVTAATSADGRIKISGPVLAVGYRLQPELTARAFVDGWFVSSDLGRIGRGQRLAVFGRVDDVAVTGGINVPLPAVDRVLAEHPDVTAAAAVALPDPSWGHRLVAVLVLRDPTHPPTLESIRAFVTERAPIAHAPKALVLADSLPTRPGGAVDRGKLATQLLGAAPA